MTDDLYKSHKSYVFFKDLGTRIFIVRVLRSYL